MIMFSVSYAGKNSRIVPAKLVLRGGASRVNRGYMLAHCGEGGGGCKTPEIYIRDTY